MAKMFYTLEEVCEKLEKEEEEIKEMVRTGQIQEFRDRDRLMFKVEQIDLLAGGEEDDTSEVHLELEDTGGGPGIGLREESTTVEDSGIGESGIGESAIGLADSREGTGVSVFDTDHGGEEQEHAETISLPEGSDISEALEDEELGLDAVGSGSGLLDLTRESDDTSLGAELLEEVYSSEENVELPAHASGLFEAAAPDKPGDEPASAIPAPGGMPMVMQAYDGGGSGLGAGLMIGALAALVCVAIVAIVGVMGGTPQLATRIAASSNSVWIWFGGLGAVTIVLGLVGLFIGKASE